MSLAPVLPSQRPSDVYLFGTCLIDLFVPEAGLDTVRLLEREGVRVHFPKDQTCCGQPAYSSGHAEEARGVARRQLDLFPEPWPVIVPSGSCAAMMRNEYALLFANEAETLKQVSALATRVWELGEFLDQVLHFKQPDRGVPCHIALHTSCAARRGTGALDATRHLLAGLENVTLEIQDHESECCGFGGMFSVLHPDIAGAMVSDKVAAIRQCGAESLVSGDCGCLLNIGGHAEKNGQELQHMHLASFLWQRTGDKEAS